MKHAQDEAYSGGRDAFEVGLALAYPESLHHQLSRLSGRWKSVDAAVRRGQAGLESLRLDTAKRNGVAVVGNPAARQPERGLPEAAEQESGDFQAARGGPMLPSYADVVGGDFDETTDDDVGEQRSTPSGFSSEQIGRKRALVVLPSYSSAEKGSWRGVDPAARLPSARETAKEGPIARREQLRGRSVAPAVGRGPAPLSVMTGGDEALGSRLPFAAAGLPDIAAAPIMSGASIGGGGLRSNVAQALRERTAAAPMGETITNVQGAQAASGPTGFAEFATRVPAPMRPAESARGLGQTGAMGGDRDGDGRSPGAGVEAAADQGSRQGNGAREIARVVMDGRLVGHILSDHMARDASRPGAGTTAFDSRQGPAWTPSGAL